MFHTPGTPVFTCSYWLQGLLHYAALCCLESSSPLWVTEHSRPRSPHSTGRLPRHVPFSPRAAQISLKGCHHTPPFSIATLIRTVITHSANKSSFAGLRLHRMTVAGTGSLLKLGRRRGQPQLNHLAWKKYISQMGITPGRGHCHQQGQNNFHP